MKIFFRVCFFVFACSVQGWSEPFKPNATGRASELANGEKVVKDTTNGALVWRPYQGNIQWTGEVNVSGFAEGKGTLVVFDRKGNRAAIFTGQMEHGHLVGDVTAKYPTSPDRAHYVGGYSAWAENGVGSMTYNNGKVETGIWKNGKLVTLDVPKDSANLLNHRAPALLAQEVNPNLEPSDPETAEHNLQNSYDKLKGSLQGNALENLKVCQRAWIKYKETALLISVSVWDKPNDPWEGADRFDAVMAVHRTKELEYVTNILFGEMSASILPNDLDEQVALLSDRLRKINMIGTIKATSIAALKEQWDQSCQLKKLLDLQDQPQNQKQQSARVLLALTTKNLNEVLDLWLATPQEIVSANNQLNQTAVPIEPPKSERAVESEILKQKPIASTLSTDQKIQRAKPSALQNNWSDGDIAEGQSAREAMGNSTFNEAVNGSVADLTGHHEASAPPTTRLLLGYLASACLIIVASIGVFMGVNEKITIYNGKWDFCLTCLIAGSAIAAAVGYSYENTPVTVLFIIATCLTLLLSFRESLMANYSTVAAALAVPAKLTFIVLIVVCGLMALGGLRSGMDELKKGNKDKAAMQFAIAAAGALGVRFFNKLIKKLIKERVTARVEPRPIAE